MALPPRHPARAGRRERRGSCASDILYGDRHHRRGDSGGIAAAGGPTVRCAPYATYGTEELSKNALRALQGRLCCLLANHGSIACGPTLRKAFWLAGELETLARQYFLSRQFGEPVILSDAEIARVIEKFKSYGPRSKA